MRDEVLLHTLDCLVKQRGTDHTAGWGVVARPMLSNARQHLLEVGGFHDVEGNPRAVAEVGDSLVCLRRVQTSNDSGQLLACSRDCEKASYIA